MAPLLANVKRARHEGTMRYRPENLKQFKTWGYNKAKKKTSVFSGASQDSWVERGQKMKENAILITCPALTGVLNMFETVLNTINSPNDVYLDALPSHC